MRGMLSILAVLLLASVAATPATRPADFAAFRDGGGLTGTAPSLPPPPMKLRWTYQASDGKETTSIESAAVISGDTVYVADDRGTLHAVDLATGKNKWKYTSDGGFAVTPLVMGGRVYVGDLSGLLHCVSAADGKKLWTFDSESGIHSSCNAVFTADGPRILFGNDGGQILCVDTDGKKVWAAAAGDRVNAAPSVVRQPDGEAVALFSGCDAHLRAIKVRDGSEVFATDLGALAGGSPAVAGDKIVVGTDQGHVRCFASDGKALWDFDKVGEEAMVYASPAIADGVVVVGARDRKVYGLELASGKLLWSTPTRGEVDSSALICEGRVYVGSKDKKLYVLDLKSGKSVWEFAAGRSITASPCIAEGVLVIGDNRGALYCLEGK